LELTDQSMSYDGSGAARSIVNIRNNPLRHAVAATSGGNENRPRETATNAEPSIAWPVHPDSTPDFGKMNPAQRRAYDAQRLARKFG